MNQSNPSPEPDPNPTSTGEPTRRKRLPKEKLATDYPSFMRQTRNPLSRNHSQLTPRGAILLKLGVTEDQLGQQAKIRDKIRAGWGSVEEAISILEGDDDPDSLLFMRKWNLLTEDERKNCYLEDILIAAGLTSRRFIELLAGATIDHDEFVARMFKSRKKLKVLESTFKAATEEIPITESKLVDGQIVHAVVGHENPDVKAMELFFKLTGDIGPNTIVNNDNRRQTANITTPPPERDPLQSMDKFLLEIEEVRKPRQLKAPTPVIIPVETPDNAPEIEYLGIDE